MINCKKLHQFLMDYIDGNLSEDERAAFEAHVNLCPPCVRYMESYKDTIDAARKCCDDEAEKREKMPEGLVDAILASRKKSE